MELDSLTIGEARQLAAMLGGNPPATNTDPGPWKIGEKYLACTVTRYFTGRLTYVGPQELVLEDAAWIADTGRYHNALVTGDLSEVEPSPNPIIVGRGAISDATAWDFDLPKEVKE